MRAPIVALVLGTMTVGPAHGPVPRLSTELTGRVFSYEIQAGDTLTSIGARYGVGVGGLARRNGRSPSKTLTPGELLIIDNRHIVWPAEAPTGAVIVINVPQRMLFRIVDGRVDAHYPVAVGRSTWRTPRGPFTIVEKEVDPTWDVPPSIQAEMRREGKPVITSIPPCPANPLGKYWIRLSHTGVGLHGTNAPASIYRFATHGCVRLHPDDAAELFERVSVGDAGLTTYDPVLLARLPDGRVFAEVHPDPYKQGPDPLGHLRTLAESAALTGAIDWASVADVIRQREGVAVDVSRPAPAVITGQPD